MNQLVSPAPETTEQLARLLGTNHVLIQCLRRLETLDLPHWYLGAGCIAQTVWNAAHARQPNAGIDDYDIVYFDPDLAVEAEHTIRLHVQHVLADLPIEPDVKNQARVHLWYEPKFGYRIRPYTSCEDAIASWPTTATAVGIRYKEGALHVEAPFTLHDLLGLVVRPNRVQITPEIYHAKVDRWRSIWPRLDIRSWADGVGAIGDRRAV
ncbi:MAG: nucleotidyltransferase family protein [Longimicrobiales bacterium]